MDYFDAKCKSLDVNNRSVSDQYDAIVDAANTGQTVKDSIHDLIKLPKWLEKLLKILNELLSILRGGS